MVLTDNRFISRLFAFLQYFGSTLVVSLMQIAINPLMAKNLDPEEYAVIGYYSSFNLLLTPFITFFLTNFFIQRFFQVDKEKRERIKATVMQLLVYLSFALSVLSLLGLYAYQVIINVESEIPFSPYALLTIFAIPLTGIYSLKLAEYRLERKAGIFARYTVTAGIFTVVFALLFVVFLKWGATGRLLATFLANLAMFIVVFILERSYFFSGFDKGIAKEAIHFCWPLSVAGMLGFFNSGLDKVLLERIGNLHELGYYSVGAQIAGYLSVFSNAVNATFQPDIYECYAKKTYKRLVLYIGIIIGSISAAVLLFIAIAPFLVDILTAGRYTYSASYARIIALSSVTAAIYYSSSQLTIAMGYTKLLLFVKIIGSVLSSIVLSIMISRWQYEGAAYGSVLSYLVFFVINLGMLGIFKRKELSGEK